MCQLNYQVYQVSIPSKYAWSIYETKRIFHRSVFNNLNWKFPAFYQISEQMRIGLSPKYQAIVSVIFSQLYLIVAYVQIYLLSYATTRYCMIYFSNGSKMGILKS